MAKVNKAYSLDLETVRILEEYCASSDNWKTTISRSKVVNDAIRWFITGDVAELVANNEKLIEKFGKVMREKHKNTTQRKYKKWWKQLLGLN